MLVSFRCLDNGDNQNKRVELLNQHLQWVTHNMNNIKVAGPLIGNSNNTHIGSLYIFEADSIEQATKILHSDPYYAADIWHSIDITEFKDYAGTWVGGQNWPGANNN